MVNRFTTVAAVAVLAAGCADHGITDVPQRHDVLPSASVVSPQGNPGLTVMTWNLYYGSDPKLVLADPIRGPWAAWGLLHETNFPERAKALAQLIAASSPDLVGVQEAALWRIQDGTDFSTTGVPNADKVEYDLLALLMAALESRGVHYVVAAVDTTTDIEVPMLVFDESGNPVFDESGNPIVNDIRLTDRDAVLVRKGVEYRDAESRAYDSQLEIPLGGGFTAVIREGWSSVVARAQGLDYRFVSTHLEIQDFGPDVQLAQAQELLVVLSGEELPTIVVGDFNSDPANPNARGSYDLMTGTGAEQGGFTDTWLRPNATSGFTCCQMDDLSNEESLFDQRVDFIFTRNMPQVGKAVSLVLGRDVVGDVPGDRISGLWPSDHGGVVATFLTTSPHVPWATVTE